MEAGILELTTGSVEIENTMLGSPVPTAPVNRELTAQEIAYVAGGVSVSVKVNDVSDIGVGDAIVFGARGCAVNGPIGAGVGVVTSITADLVDVPIKP